MHTSIEVLERLPGLDTGIEDPPLGTSLVIPRFLEKLRSTPVAEYDVKEDASRLLRQIEDSEAGRHPFRVPLPVGETASLCDALHRHLL